MLMDLFYECLPTDNRLRMHFHRFMQRVHRELTALSGTADPLQSGLAAESSGMLSTSSSSRTSVMR